MSIWTHVIGAIRFDGIQGLMSEPDLGYTVNYEDEGEVWDRCDVPQGSEGSLQYTMNTNPDESALARWTACIFGDLRDYDDDEEIVAYFNRITEGRLCRGGAFCIECEGRDIRTFVLVDKVWNEIL